MIKKFKLKTWILIGAIVLITLFIARPIIEKGMIRVDVFDTKTYAIDFIDDSGYRIRMERPADTIISLYSAHTENLYALGIDREIIGVGTSDIYPYEVLSKEVFDYKSDPEKVISARPDAVIIRPFIERHSPDFVNTLRRSGVTVISLYPDNFNDFDAYIKKLAMLSGKEKFAQKKLKEFHEELDLIRDQNKDIESKVGVYFESSDREYKTVTKASMPANAIVIAGGRNVADDAVPIEKGSSIAIYGIEKILQKADEIDVYVTQRGVMGAGGNYHTISVRPGFDVLKAVKENRILEINQKIISSPTFRYVKGVKALQRTFYPDIYDKIIAGENNEAITREELAEVLSKYTHEVIYVPTKSYYKDENKEHYYGNFSDVTIEHKSFDIIETAMQKSYFKTTIIDEVEFFYPEQLVTREEFARILYLLNDLKINDDIEILDDVENQRIVKSVVSAGLMSADKGLFKGSDSITWSDIIKGLDL